MQKREPNYDKLYKIRPIFDKLRQKFNKIEQEEFHNVDEQMILYKGRHSLKQYVPKESPISGDLKCSLGQEYWNNI